MSRSPRKRQSNISTMTWKNDARSSSILWRRHDWSVKIFRSEPRVAGLYSTEWISKERQWGALKQLHQRDVPVYILAVKLDKWNVAPAVQFSFVCVRCVHSRPTTRRSKLAIRHNPNSRVTCQRLSFIPFASFSPVLNLPTFSARYALTHCGQRGTLKRTCQMHFWGVRTTRLTS